MDFRWVTGQEMINMLQPIILRNGWTPLNPATAMALVASEENVLCGFEILQLFPLLGPKFVEKDLRGSGISEELDSRMEEYLKASECRGLIVIADSPFTAKACEEKKLKKVTSPVYIMTGKVA